jgi:hypothetical protein
MASILKVDTIQDQSGNNIINESADTITIGASGDTITIPSGATISNSGTLGAGMGKVLQVVNFIYNGADVNTTSSSFVDTDLETSITPSSTSNKILILVTFQGQTDANGIYTLSKGDTNLVGTYGFARLEVANKQTGYSFSYLDSPSTTSATTYKLRMRTNGLGTVYFHPGGTTSTATMQLLEIAG